jgi:hypothetical protein
MPASGIPPSRPHNRPAARDTALTATPTAAPQEHGRAPEKTRAGVDVIRGASGDMGELGIYESFRVKNQVG